MLLDSGMFSLVDIHIVEPIIAPEMAFFFSNEN